MTTSIKVSKDTAINSIAIKVDNLSYTYAGSDTQALSNVTFNIDSGQCIGLIGPNGAGKSTLISLLTGLLSPCGGRISYEKTESTSIVESVKHSVALVPQEYAFYNDLTIKQNLSYFLSLTEQPDNQALLAEIIESCQLTSVINKKAKQVSGGYKRRLNLAIALLKKPRVLFLDEPTVGIDPISRELILALITQLKSQGITIIYTSHLLSEVQQISDRVFGISEGKLFEINRQEKSANLVITWQQPLTELAISQLKGLNIEFKQNSEYQVEFIHCNLPQQCLAKLPAFENNSIDEINYSKINLEQYYLELFLPK